jgi:hypothetical protein
MKIGDWILAVSGRYWYMSYIDSISKNQETVYVTKAARFIGGIPEYVKSAPAICSLQQQSLKAKEESRSESDRKQAGP